jgi:hypothetical protein
MTVAKKKIYALLYKVIETFQNKQQNKYSEMISTCLLPGYIYH